jgi:hypothetical protein
MRVAVATALMLALAACSPPSGASGPAAAGDVAQSQATATAPNIAPQSFSLQTEAVVGSWSFDGSCGLYDLVFHANANVDYFDYSDQSHVASYGGQWAEDLPNNRVTLTLQRLDGEGHLTGQPIDYVLDIITPPNEDLNGRFGRADGTVGVNIHAKRCPQEDRD